MSDLEPEPIDSVARRAYRKLEPEIESWLVDTGKFLLIFASLLIAYIVFKIFRAVGISSDFMDSMERLDHYCVTCIFVLFLLTLVRRAFEVMIAPNKG